MKRLFLISALLLFSADSFAQEYKATIIKSPNVIPTEDSRLKLFLGGSIDMGKSENWQARIEKQLSNYNVIVLNPRRDDWNKEWQPISTDKNFRKQVEWELSALEASDIVVMYFAPGSQSPISLLEFGLYAKTGKLIVLCPDGFWRKGNVDIVSEKYNISTVNTFNELIVELKKLLSPKSLIEKSFQSIYNLTIEQRNVSSIPTDVQQNFST